MNATMFDHRGPDIDRWLDAYSGGEPIGKAEVYSAVSGTLGPILRGYRYLRTKGVFHLSDATADQYVSLDRGKGILSLRFGLTHHSVERARESLFGPRAGRLQHTPLTISMYTANMGPHSQGWHLPYRVQWPVLGQDGLSLAVPQITAFVEETVLPYLEHHRRPEAIRNTYLQTPRHADFYLLSEQIVFAVNHMLGSRDRLELDRDALLAQRRTPEDRHRVVQAFATALGAQNAG
jgi:hypothetical protein